MNIVLINILIEINNSTQFFIKLAIIFMKKLINS